MRGPRFRTLAGQFTVLTAVPMTALLLAIATLTLYINQKTRLDTLRNTDVLYVGLLAERLMSATDLPAEARSIVPPVDLEIALLDPDGRVVAHSLPEKIGWNLASSGAVAGRPFGRPSGATLRPALGLSQTLTAFVPIPRTGLTLASQRAWSPLREAISGIGLLILVPLLVAASVPTFLIGLSARRVTRPIRELAGSARRLSAADFRPVRVTLRTGDEIEDLADQFNVMAGHLRSLYDSLEQRVADRTTELQGLLALARAVSLTLDPSKIAAIAHDQLLRHPSVTAVALCPSAAVADVSGIPSAPPTWLDSPDARQALEAALGAGDVAGPSLHAGTTEDGPVSIQIIPLRLQAGNAALAVRAVEFTPDLVRYLDAVAAHIAVALDNALLYRRARTVAAMEERNRLAREIHDTLAQSLTAVIVQLEAVVRTDTHPGQTERIERVLELARMGMREARRSVQGLRSTALDSATLDEALAAQVAGLEQSGSLQARFGLSGEAAAIPPSVAAELYRIAEEAITNIQRHAAASNVLVNLLVTPEAARLVIEDDGRGFHSADAPAGFGLVGMHERARRIGGKLELESEPGEGTRLQVYVPLSAADPTTGIP